MITVHPNDNGNITVAEGSIVELMCEATGNGNLTYQWKRESGSLPGNARKRKTPTLTINKIKVNDSGGYYCEVNDDDGGDNVPSMRVQVTVKSESLITNCIMFNSIHTGKPSIIDSSSDQALSIISGNEQVTLTCEVTGDDIVGGYWESMDGVQLTNRNMSSLSNDKRTITMTITRARPEHSGMYYCVAYSQWGVGQSRNVQVTITSESNNVLM